MPTNFHLAPPAKTVGGLFAVPIDIQELAATFRFDGTTQAATSDATITFVTGSQAGCPIFDLRQPISQAWLDGVPIPAANLSHRDFGGGTEAELRVINSVLPANTTHTLRVTYAMGIPQASTAGSYQPQLSWSPGPRLTFAFGFTDLGAGRYLESWLPANLIYDQFACSLTIQLVNIVVPHSVITNGTVSNLGSNHWQITFPARFTAVSHLLEVRASDTLLTQSSTVLLPVSGNNVIIDAWKLQSGPADLTTQINNVKTFLTNNETNVGSYIHGNRFVAFLNVGGMEYEGGTTTSTGALSHETFHSWWARGVKPASQPDGWWDEAWTTYFNDAGGTLSTPFDFTRPPIELRSSNPYVRITASNAYGDGNKFWQGVSSLLGNSQLKAYMKEFYQLFKGKLARTTDIEEYLLCRSGNTTLVDAFHRFVYGFANPTATPDLWLKDDSLDTAGNADWNGRFWDSPDVWVRNQDDEGTTHQPPEYGQDNWLYARVRNKGNTTVRHFVVCFNVKQFAGTQFVYPNDFLPCTAAASGFDLAQGNSTVVKAKWPRQLVPPAGTHACLLAAVITRNDHPVNGKHVWEHNNLAQKNVTIVDLKPGNFLILPFVIANHAFLQKRAFSLELIRPAEFLTIPTSLLHEQTNLFSGFEQVRPFLQPNLDTKHEISSTHLDCSGHLPSTASHDKILTDDTIHLAPSGLLDAQQEIIFKEGNRSALQFTLAGRDQLLARLKIQVPPNIAVGKRLRFDIVQRDVKTQKIVGGIAIEVNVIR